MPRKVGEEGNVVTPVKSLAEDLAFNWQVRYARVTRVFAAQWFILSVKVILTTYTWVLRGHYALDTVLVFSQCSSTGPCVTVFYTVNVPTHSSWGAILVLGHGDLQKSLTGTSDSSSLGGTVLSPFYRWRNCCLGSRTEWFAQCHRASPWLYQQARSGLWSQRSWPLCLDTELALSRLWYLELHWTGSCIRSLYHESLPIR